MKRIKSIGSKCKIVIFIVMFTLILTIVNLIWVLGGRINSLIGLIGILLYSFAVGIKVGGKATSKGYLEGLKTGLINVVILYGMGLLFGEFRIVLKKIIYYAVIVLMTILGSIIGINRKKN